MFKLIPFLVFLVSCSQMDFKATQKLDPEIYYRHDIVLEDRDSDKKYVGVGVLPYRRKYDLKIDTHANISFFSMNTCHEEDTDKDPDGGLFRRNGIVKIEYKPLFEPGRACPLHVNAFNKRQRHAFGYFAFEHPRYELPATLYCNGSLKNYGGVSVCMSREGLAQRIIFEKDVLQMDPVPGSIYRVDRKVPCPFLLQKRDAEGRPTGEKVKRAKDFVFILPGRECIYGFMEIATGKVHQLHTIGYEDIIIRD